MVVLGLGSNLGDRKSHLEQAIQKIVIQRILNHVRVSSIYESEALLPPNAPHSWNKPYLNLAICGETTLPPRALLKEIKNLEYVLGREAAERWAPRQIDIDILAWDNHVITTEELTIPHHGLLDRPFALWPLAELCPDWTYPVSGLDFSKTAQQLKTKWDPIVPFNTHQTTLNLTPEWVGILNITPDSFSDGGLYLDPQHATRQAHQLVQDGATVLDMGAESMRPGASPLNPNQEWERLHPILKSLQKEFSYFTTGPTISVDTRHHEVAKKAIDEGVHWINDVSGFDDPQMRQVVAGSSVELVVMHHLGTPPHKDRVLPLDQDPIDVLLQWAHHRFEQLTSLGISPHRLIFDPGIGFGKTAEQSLALIRHCGRFHQLGVRLLVGHSRKSFFNLFTDKPFAERDVETAIISTYLAREGVQYIRVHNVASNVRALKVASALVQ